MKVRFATAAIVACLAAAGQAATDRVADFRVGGVSFVLPIPNGYCLPTGRSADIAQLMAASDTTNVTDLTLVQCEAKPTSGASDYTIIKSPRNALLLTVDRATVLKSVGKEFDKKLDPNMWLAPASNGISAVLGAKVDISGTFLPRGKDDVCAYMGGVIHYDAPAGSYDQPMGGCITAVGGRVLYIYRTGTKGDNAGVLALMRETRMIALSIKTIDGT